MPAFVDALQVDADGIVRHDIAALSQMLREKFPGNAKLTARAAMHILAMTRATLQVVFAKAEEADVQWVGPSEELRESLIADLLELAGRLDLYEYQIAGLSPGDAVPLSVLPLLFLVEGDKTGMIPFFTPEWLTPFVVDNQLIELEQHRREVQGYFRELIERTIELVQDPLPDFPDLTEHSDAVKTGVVALMAGVAAIGVGYAFGRMR